MATKKNYPYRKPNIGDICVAGPKGRFNHQIKITRIDNGRIYHTSKVKEACADMEITLFKRAIEEGWWKYKYNFSHYLKQAELCIE